MDHVQAVKTNLQSHHKSTTSFQIQTTEDKIRLTTLDRLFYLFALSHNVHVLKFPVAGKGLYLVNHEHGHLEQVIAYN